MSPAALVDDAIVLVQAMQTFCATERITLNLLTHMYRRGATALIGVTDALHAAGILDNYWFHAEQATEGSVMHRLAVETVATPDVRLDLEEMWGPYVGYGRSLDKFLVSACPSTIATELLVAYVHTPCAGTLDWLAVWHDALWVIDWKTGAELKWHALQTAGYLGALLDRIKAIQPVKPVPVAFKIRRASLYLHEDGQAATLRAHYKPSDEQYFQAAVACTAFARGLTP